MAPFKQADARASYVENAKKNFNTVLNELVGYLNKPSRHSLFGGGIGNDEDEGREESEAEGDGGTDEDEDKNETEKCEDRHEMDDGDKHEADEEEDKNEEDGDEEGEEVNTDTIGDSNGSFQDDLEKKSHSVEGGVEPHRRSYLTSSEGRGASPSSSPLPPPYLQKSCRYRAFFLHSHYSPPLPPAQQTPTSRPNFDKGMLLNPYSVSPFFHPTVLHKQDPYERRIPSSATLRNLGRPQRNTTYSVAKATVDFRYDIRSPPSMAPHHHEKRRPR